MARRSFIGEAGRPFGTLAALLCLLLVAAAIVLGDVAHDMTGGVSPFEAADPARLAAMRPVWGLLLASEIVKAVTGCAILLAVWTLARPIGPRTPGSVAALALGTIGALALMVASRQGIEAAAWLSEPRLSPWGSAVAALTSVAFACLGLWAGLLMLEARAAASLPRWVQLVGMAFAAAALAAAFVPQLAVVMASVSLVWWGGVFATLYKPADRAMR